MQEPLNMKNHHARVAVQSWVCLNESLHVQYHDDQNLENIYKITVTEISLIEPRILVQISETQILAEKTNFGWFQIFHPKLKKLTLLLKNSILSSCKRDSFLLSLHFFNLFFTIFFFFNCFCFLNKFIVIFLKNAVRYLSTFYRVQRYKQNNLNSPWNVFFGGDMIHFRTCCMHQGQETSMNLYQVSKNWVSISKILFIRKFFGNFSPKIF